MLLTLIKALNTSDLMKVLAHLSMAPIDIDLLLYKAIENGEIEVDRVKNKIKVLKEPDSLYYHPELAQKIKDIIKEYDKQEANITRNRLEFIVLDPQGRNGYKVHDFVCTMYAMVENKEVNTYEITVPEIKGKRPFNRFNFYTFEDHQKFGKTGVDEFVAQFDKGSVK